MDEWLGGGIDGGMVGGGLMRGCVDGRVRVVKCYRT